MLIYMKIWGLARLYWFAFVVTVIVWAAVGWKLGSSALLTVIALSLLETTFSADNAVVNSKVLSTMSPAWRRAFMTVGILVAVFVVRFILPVALVTLTAHIGFHEVFDLALHHPTQYEHYLTHAEPLINAFGGTFLIMIALNFFVDARKRVHWIGFLERNLGKLGKFDNATTIITLLIVIVLYLTVDRSYRNSVAIAALAAIVLHIGLELLGDVMGGHEKHIEARHKVGMAAAMAFLYLEVLDASFSLDGVIGAFVLTNSVILIMAGLGVGAVWVRAMTIHLVRAGALVKYVFLEHGAHWAIGLLGPIMLLRLYHVHPPEWLVGGIGLICIASAIVWSKHYSLKNQRAAER
jgi:uncharacterized protein